MTYSHPDSALRGADRFDAIEALLLRYPAVDADEIATLTHWFRKEASAFDVASLASKDTLADGYRQFRADHIDRISGGDVLRALLFAIAVIALIALIMARGL